MAIATSEVDCLTPSPEALAASLVFGPNTADTSLNGAGPPPDDPPSELWVKRWDSQETRTREYGLVSQQTVVATLNDGTSRVVRLLQPTKDPETDRSILILVPWLTRIDGFNTRAALKLAERFMVRLVGTEQTPGQSLEHSARSANAINQAADEIYGIEDPKKPIGSGFSMGGMTASGLDASFILSIDPWIAKGRRLGGLVTPENFWGLIQESLALGRVAIDETVESFTNQPFLEALEHLHELTKTASLSPAYFHTQLDKMMTLLTGEAGKLAAQVPPETAMVIHFLGNKLNDRKHYKAILAGRPNVGFVDEQNWWHIDAARPVAVRGIVGKLSTAMSLVEQGANPEEMVGALSEPILPERKPYILSLMSAIRSRKSAACSN